MAVCELRAQYAKLLTDAQSINEKVIKENRSEFSAEEQEQFTRLTDEAQKVGNRIEFHERKLEIDAKIAKLQDPVEHRAKVATQSTAQDPAKEWRSVANGYLRTGRLTSEQRAAYVQGDDQYGGYLVAPLTVYQGLLTELRQKSVMRQLARVFPPLMGSGGLGVVSQDSDAGSPAWTSEIGTIGVASRATFGRRELIPHKLAKYIEVSYDLLNQSNIDFTQWALDHLQDLFAEAEEEAFINGTGVNQPLGIFTASTYGISTSRDQTGTNTTTSIAVASLYDALYTLTEAQRNVGGLNWVMHPSVWVHLLKKVDGDSRFLIQPSLTQGAPSTLLGIPVVLSTRAPSTFTAGRYVAVLGNFQRGYWVVDSDRFSVQRLDESGALNDKVLFVGRRKSDGMPVQESNFVRLKLAAS